jgi:hypothetical protein
VTVVLADADLREEESAFDLAIAVGSLQPKGWPAPIPDIGPAGDSL